MKSNFEYQWQELAGNSSRVCMRPILQGPDPEFLRELSSLESIFRSAERVDFCERYLKDQSQLTPQLKRWAESRRALIEVLKPLLGSGISPAQIFISLSHTQDHCIAVSAVREERGLVGVGVDLESSSRAVSPRAAERFIRPSESALGLSSLQAWTLKEACYKADPNNNDTLIPHYEITGISRVDGQVQSDRHAEICFRTKLLQSSDHLVALAVAWVR